MNGEYWPRTTPLMLSKGQRVEIELVNHSMMAHPIHLHGHAFQVIAIDDRPIPRRRSRHRAGHSDEGLCPDRVRRQQSRTMGVPLPQSLPHDDRHDDGVQVSGNRRLTI